MMKNKEGFNRKKLAIFIIALAIVLLLVGAILILIKDTTIISNNDTTIAEGNTTTISNNTQEIISDKQWDNAENTMSNLDELIKPYLNSKGYTELKDVSNILNIISKYLEEQKEKGIVSEYVCGEHSVTIIFDGGMTYIYTPTVKRALNGTGTSKIITLESADSLWDKIIRYNKEVGAELDALLNKNLGIAGNLDVSDNIEFITNETNKFIYDDNSKFKKENFTIETLKSLGNFSILVFEGHGSWNDKNQSCYLSTGEKANKKDKKYENEISKGEIAIAHGPLQASTYAVSPNFLNQVLKVNENSFVFLGNCYSLKNDKLAKAFINKGAYAVVGYDDGVDIAYEKLTRSYFFRLATQKDDYGNYMTVEDVVETVQRRSKTYLDGLESQGEISIILNTNETVRHTLFETLSCISGIVKDKETDSPISETVIEVLNSNSDNFETIATTKTDEKGEFKLYLAQGDYSISFNHSGYDSYGTSVEVFDGINATIEPVLLVNKLGKKLIADESDFENLTELFNHIGVFGVPFEYNANQENSYENIINELLDVVGACTLYQFFYDESPEKFDVMQERDPLNQFTEDDYAYAKISANKLDWLIKNIFNVKPIRNNKTIDMNTYYYYQGYYYWSCTDGGDVGDYLKIKDKKLNDDNSYTVTFNMYFALDDSFEGSYKAECALKMIDGKKQWTFTSIEKI